MSSVAWSQYFLPDFRYLKCLEDEWVLFVVMHLMYSQDTNRIYCNAGVLSSIRGEIFIATNLTSVYFRQNFSRTGCRFFH